MAGRRVYGGSEMTVLLQDDGISVGNYEDFFPSSSSHGGFNGSRSILNFEEVSGSAINNQFYRQRETEEESIDDDLDDCLHHRPEKKRRLTASQVQFLEKCFEVDNKLEPERKIQLAKDLGLQPRQVAIWYQNRRARWKTKQLEKDYETLKSSYDVLKADYDKTVKEKEKLRAEVLHLSERLLLKEKHKGIAEALELGKPGHNSTMIDIKKTETQLVEVKQEDQSSTSSAVSGSGSPPCRQGAPTDSSKGFEPDQSDTSYVEEDNEVKVYHQFLKLDDHSGGFDFPVEEHPFWLWP